MGRRANGEGSIHSRKDGRYAASISLGNGKRKHFLSKNRAVVAAQLADALRKQHEGLPVKLERQTFSAYITFWLDSMKPTLKPRTWLRYEQVVRLYAGPALGKMTLEKIAPQHVQNLYTELAGKGLSASTVRHVHAVIHKALKQALLWNLLGRNPADAVTAPKPRRTEMKYLSPEQARLLLLAARGNRHEALITLALTTGMRQGEVLGLRWDDVDLDLGVVRVQRSLQRTKEGFVLVEPKTARSRRQIVMTDVALQALEQHRVNQTAERLLNQSVWTELGLVFTTPTGGPIDGTHLLRQCFYPLLTKASLPKIRFHDLRHTAATLLLGQGIHPKIVSEMLGHSTIAITLDLYSHVTPTMQREAVSAMDSLLRP